MGHCAIARVTETLALELFNRGDAGTSDDAPAHHGVRASDNHAVVGLSVRRPANNHRAAAADHNRSVPPASANQFFRHGDAGAPRDVGGALRDELLHVEAVLCINPRLVGGDERHLIERNVAQTDPELDELLLRAGRTYSDKQQGDDET